jgi:DNA-binding transcriptional LysR family regulator
MENLRALINFVRVAELGSFSKAALELGISAVAVSKNVSKLEQSLGVRLLARSTRELQLTAEGRMFLDQCKGPLGQLDQACTQVRSDAQTDTGWVRVNLVSPVAPMFLLPQLPAFVQQHPHIQLQLELSDTVDSLITGGFDVGIRAGSLTDAGYVARPLGPLRLLTCASPAYLQQQGTPQTIDDLLLHPALQLQIAGQDKATPWVFWQADNNNGMAGSTGSVRALHPKPRLLSNDYRSLLTACVSGLGIGQFPQPLVMAALRDGSLQSVLQQCTLPGLQLFVHYPSRKHLPARVRAFVDFVVQGLAGHEDLTTDPAALTAAPARLSKQQVAKVAGSLRRRSTAVKRGADVPNNAT